jgi:hypothetical protein
MSMLMETGMTEKRSLKAVLEFLEYVAQKGLMSPATARARKAAVGKVLGILSEEEARDVTNLDLDSLMTRFGHLQGREYTPDSLVTYKSRVKSALDDFARYMENPLAFKPSVQARERKSGGAKASTNAKSDNATKATEMQPRGAQPAPSGPMASSILPIPIRSDLTVYIQGLPFDLSAAEAKKIAAVIQAMALTA